MNVRSFMELMDLSERLKNNTRHSWTSSGRHESVAEHSWRLTLMAYFVKDEFPQADMDKVIRMCILHDFGEAFTGDIPAFLKTDRDSDEETDQIRRWVSSLPEPFAAELTELFREMEALETTEAKIYKALDKMEAVIQHNEADIATWLPLEYDLQMTYGTKEVEFSQYMKALKAEANRISAEKIRQRQQNGGEA